MVGSSLLSPAPGRSSLPRARSGSTRPHSAGAWQPWSRLGAKLLVRRPHGSELTDAGAALLTALERGESEFLSVQARLTATEAAVAGIVRVGVPDGFGVGFLAPRLAALVKRHPQLRVQLVPTPRSFSLS